MFRQVKNQLTVSARGHVLKNYQIVVPEKLQRRVIQIAHKGHMEIDKTKSLLREYTRFPNINHKVEKFV